MRITDNMRFNTTVNNLFNSQSQYNDLIEKTVTQKKVNRASDDPIAATKIIDIRQGIAANGQYRKNIEDGDAWISMTESKLSSAYDLLVKAREIALGQATATATATGRKIASEDVQALIDEMTGLANAKFGDRYLFSGSRNDVEPFSTVQSAPTIKQAQEAAGNTFDGTVTSSGTYTGELNKTYAVKIIEGGTPAAATYQFSSDGGRTWNGTDPDFGTVSASTEGSGTAKQTLKGSVANAAGGLPITAATVWNTITGASVQDGTTFTITGKKHDGAAVSDSYTITDATTGTVNDLLSRIQTTFGNTVTATIDAAGKITIEDTTAGDSQLEMTLVGSLPMTAGGIVDLEDGVQLTFGAPGGETFGENDVFYVNAVVGGYYQGNNDRLSMTIGRGMNVAQNITGAEAFTASGGAGVDVFKTLNDLKSALDGNDVLAISAQLENLKGAQDQVVMNQSLCGTKASHLEMAKNNLDNLDEKLTSLLSDAQDADLADYATRLSMKEIALQASYAMAVKLRETTILKFLT
jgi:flagellar hook-associated protein 3